MIENPIHSLPEHLIAHEALGVKGVTALNDLYVNVTGDTMSGQLTINAPLLVNDTVEAIELNLNQITSGFRLRDASGPQLNLTSDAGDATLLIGSGSDIDLDVNGDISILDQHNFSIVSDTGVGDATWTLGPAAGNGSLLLTNSSALGDTQLVIDEKTEWSTGHLVTIKGGGAVGSGLRLEGIPSTQFLATDAEGDIIDANSRTAATSTPYTVLTTDYYIAVRTDTIGGNATVYLPDDPASGRLLIIKNADQTNGVGSPAGTVTVLSSGNTGHPDNGAGGTNVIDRIQTSYTLFIRDAMELRFDGVNTWEVTNFYLNTVA